MMSPSHELCGVPLPVAVVAGLDVEPDDVPPLRKQVTGPSTKTTEQINSEWFQRKGRSGVVGVRLVPPQDRR